MELSTGFFYLFVGSILICRTYSAESVCRLIGRSYPATAECPCTYNEPKNAITVCEIHNPEYKEDGCTRFAYNQK